MDKLREKFEIWFRKELIGSAEERGEDLELYNLDADHKLEKAEYKGNVYKDHTVREMWNCYQAAYAQAISEFEQVGFVDENDLLSPVDIMEIVEVYPITYQYAKPLYTRKD